MLYASPSTFDHFEGVKELQEKGIIDQFYLAKSKGTKIGKEMSSGNRIGAFLLYGQDIQELEYKNSIVKEVLEAYDTEGTPVLRKELLQVAL